MSEVLKARDRHLNRVVAIKRLLPNALGDDRARKRFLREAHLAAELRHPNLTTIYDVFESEGHTFIAMEYVEGETLAQRLENGPLPLAQAVNIGIQVARALIAAHKQNIIHRDIKPENIKITPEGQVRVLDFGLARRVSLNEPPTQQKEGERTPGGWVTQEGFMVGTPGYTAPEQWAGVDIDGRVDVFSLGVMLYETVSGRAPFTGRSSIEQISATVYDDPEPLITFVHVPPSFEAVIRRALAKDRDQRYQSMEELLAALEQVQRQLNPPVASRPTRPTQLTLTTRLTRWRPKALIYGTALLVGVGMAMFLNSRAVMHEDLSLPLPPNRLPSLSAEALSPPSSQTIAPAAATRPITQPARSKRRVPAKESDNKTSRIAESETKRTGEVAEAESNKVGGFFKKMGGGIKKVGGIFKGGDDDATANASRTDKKP